MTILLALLIVGVLLSGVSVVWLSVRAERSGSTRMLEWYVMGQCVPAATAAEVHYWAMLESGIVTPKPPDPTV